ncbi:hypothetical protein ASF22_05135 [Methylobacterium sp. Leaf87]|uniref:hypothetical protein n=1 Tax=Methylobacterium sp. Leaf87 TaxID=1736243 RepID=UPI0006F5891D|nr:hypothetical protein [Methylobacterium sp. Leaf87]KQO66053.1 hypothetical protein ASF22_05135 [Methylobacterium sp. Leaf87]
MPNAVESILRIAAEGLVALVAACNRLRLPGTQHPFVVGVHTPMREELTLLDLPVTGTIPAGLDGRYLPRALELDIAAAPVAVGSAPLGTPFPEGISTPAGPASQSGSSSRLAAKA